MKIIIKEKNIYLRKIILKDADKKYLSWLNDKEVNQYLETRHQQQTINSIKQYIKENNDNSILMAICIRKNNKHIGNIKIGPINYFHKTADISYFIGDKNEWGKGYATNAVKLSVKYSFQTLNLTKCSAGVYKNNIGSSKVLLKSGFFRDASLKSEFIFNSKRVDHIIYSILNKKNNEK